MKISIITITYNSAGTLEQTMLSVLSQTYKNIEYIIVDGASTDGTMDIVNKYKDRIAKIVSEKDKGLYDALNKGISMASGDVIGILHSDDFYTSNNVIEKIAGVFAASGCDGVYANLYYVDKNNTAKIIRKWNSGLYKEGLFINGWMPPHPTFFVKKACYETFGGFDLNFTSSADYELMLRFIQKHKIKLGYLPEYIINMRMGGQSNVTAKNRIIANLEDRKAWEKNGLRPRFYTLYLKPLRKLLQFF
ncbi:MAG: glycosyltransferase family 2 protein [Bacteroidia bacterium]